MIKSKDIALSLLILASLLPKHSWAQDQKLELDESIELELLSEEDPQALEDVTESMGSKDKKSEQLDDLEEVNDLESFKTDIGEIFFEEEPDEITAKKSKKADAVEIFDVSGEEKKLLELSKFVEGKIPNDEWNEVATAAKVESYVVQKGDWLWKISQRLFGSGFYYSKIWSLNPQITNPHEIEPGMTLIFTTGDANQMPEVKLGNFKGESLKEAKQITQEQKKSDVFNFKRYGDAVKPAWISERKKLMDEGVYFQYASEETLKDLEKIASEERNTEYQKYDAPVTSIQIKEPLKAYDEQGFDKNSKINFNSKEGFHLNTFVTTNIVQDLGQIVGMPNENIFILAHDDIFVDFDRSAKVKPGDRFSIYAPGGVVNHKSSDRQGYKYTITGQIKVTKAFKDNRWKCRVTYLNGVVQRGDRITIYTPKVSRIIKTFSKRNIEAALVGGYEQSAGGISMGNVVYLDRGRADGVEMGTVFELYDFKDQGTDKRLTTNPSYKTGEVVVISLTDNFSTALVSTSTMPIELGTLAITKTEEAAALARLNKKRNNSARTSKLSKKALDELDVELNLDDLSGDLLEKAENVKLTADEIEELDRLEREKSVIKDHEKDLKDLERLESEIVDAESAINEAKLDEDKFLEQEDLNAVERKNIGKTQEHESLDDLEEEFGLKYMDENLNSKENPYGLTEFDLEEIDELLNTEKL